MSSDSATPSAPSATVQLSPAATSSDQPAAAAPKSAANAKARRAAKVAQKAGAEGGAVHDAAAAHAAGEKPRYRPDGSLILSKAEKKAKEAAERAAAAGAASSSSATAGGAGSTVLTSGPLRSNSHLPASQQQQRTASNKAPPSSHTHPTSASASYHPIHSSPTVCALFGNVQIPPSASLLSATLTTSLHKRTVHPSVLMLCSLVANHTLTGANARAMAVLMALRDFVQDYTTPQGATLTRDLVTKLGVQIGHLKEARPLGTSVGHAIRYLKYEISVTDKDWNEARAKEHLLSRIDHFVRDRIIYAGRLIEQHVHSKIQSGMTVLTYARSSIVESTLLSLHLHHSIPFSVIVIDSGRPLNEGKALLANLSKAGIRNLTFGPLSAVSTLMPRADLVLLGTASLLANGALYARAGTSIVAMTAAALGKPVIVECETYKFSDRVQLDSFASNEAGGAWDLMVDDMGDEETMELDAIHDLASSPAGRDGNRAEEGKLTKRKPFGAVADAKGPLTISQAIKLRENLNAVNLLYDVTPPRFVTAVASEVGLSGPESVGIILRDYKSVLFGV